MSQFKERRCYECGKGVIRKTPKPGRRERYKTMTLEIPSTIGIPTCTHCNTEWMDEATSAEITAALALLYKERLHELVDEALQVLSKYVPTGRLEALLGLTKGYFSRLRARTKDPRSSLVGELALLAKDPKKRLRELEDVWEQRAS